MKILSFPIAMLITPFIGMIQWIIYDLYRNNYIVMSLYHYIIFIIYYYASKWAVETQINKLNVPIIKGVNKYLHCYISPIALVAVGTSFSYAYSIYDDDTIFKISYLNTFVPIAFPVAVGAFVGVRRHNKKAAIEAA